MAHEHRVLTIPGLLNTRDLGGLPIKGGAETRFGRIVRGPGVDTLQQPGVDAVIGGLGITRELDLRDETTGRRGPESLLARQVEQRYQISAVGADDQAAALENFRREFDWDHASDYLRDLSSPGVPRIFGLPADDSNRPNLRTLHHRQRSDRHDLQRNSERGGSATRGGCRGLRSD